MEPSDVLPADPRPAVEALHRTSRIWDRFLDSLAQVDVGRPADQVLRKVEGQAKDLGRQERKILRSAFFGFLRNRRQVQDGLIRAMQAERKPLDTLSPPTRQELELLAYLSWMEAQTPPSNLQKRYQRVLDRIAQRRLPKSKRTEAQQEAIEANVPDWVFERWSHSFGLDRARELGSILRQRAPATAFVRGDRLQALAAIPEGEPTRWSPSGIIMPPDVPWSRYPDWVAHLEPQDEGSQLLAWAAARPWDRPSGPILDACAGAAGKTLALAHLTPSVIHAVEPEPARLVEGKRRIKRVGRPDRVHFFSEPLEAHAKRYPSQYGVVLVDAPCTGIGTLRRHPDLALRLDKHELEQHVSRQKRLLAAAVHALAPGGVLVYATCSLFEEENEQVVDYLSMHSAELRPCPVFDPSQISLPGTRLRVGPGPTPKDPDGFFVAAFRKEQ